jgi:glycosyltransferase involved in cell wall biosynthesis
MGELIVATSTLAKEAVDEIRKGLHYRIDYLELASRLGADYISYSSRDSYPGPVERIEHRVKLDVYWAWELARQVRRRRYGSVFSMSERIGIPLAYTLPAGVRHVVMLHHPISPRKLQFLKLTGAAHRWDKALVFSDAEREVVRSSLQLPAERIGTLHFPMDTSFFRPVDLKSEPEGERFIFSIGLSHRDYPTLLKAMATLPDVRCQISGTSAWVNHRAGYEGFTLPENVEARAYDHPSIIRQVYQKSQFVVIPIRPDTTQWSAGAASVLQPQAMGRPVVATKMPGLSDYVEDGVTGILVEPGNPEAMAEAIRDLWDHPEKVAKMGKAAVTWVQENFSLDKWLYEVIAVLEPGSGMQP